MWTVFVVTLMMKVIGVRETLDTKLQSSLYHARTAFKNLRIIFWLCLVYAYRRRGAIMTIKQPITLSNGRTFTFRLLPNGANEIVEDMTGDEWEEYCALCVANIRRLAEETEIARKLANQKWRECGVTA